jgi:hypothetical protein
VVGKNRIETETYANLAYEVTSACENKSGDRSSGIIARYQSKASGKLFRRLNWWMMKRQEIGQTGMK